MTRPDNDSVNYRRIRSAKVLYTAGLEAVADIPEVRFQDGYELDWQSCVSRASFDVDINSPSKVLSMVSY